jgi:hypothetical protein
MPRHRNCPSPPDGADHVESLLGQVVVFAVDDAVVEARKRGDPDIYRAALLQFATQREILAVGEFLATWAPLGAMRAYFRLSLLETPGVA